MSLVEVMVALVILTVSVYMLTSTITATIGHTRGRRERASAVEASTNLVERMRNAPFEQLFALYNDDPNDDPGGAGTAPGKHFTIEGLDPRAEDIDGFVGEVILPAASAPLREDRVEPDLGLPRDLDGDLQIDATDHSNDYLVLPVIIRVQWAGAAGSRTFELTTMFADWTRL